MKRRQHAGENPEKEQTGPGFCDFARIWHHYAGFCALCCFNQVFWDSFAGSCVFVLALSRGAFFCLFVFSFFRLPLFVSAFGFCDVLYVCGLVEGVFEVRLELLSFRFLFSFGVFGAPLCSLGPIWQNSPYFVHYKPFYHQLGLGSRAVSPRLVVFPL